MLLAIRPETGVRQDMSRHSRRALMGLLVMPALVSLALFGPSWTTFAPHAPGIAATGSIEVVSEEGAAVGFDETLVPNTLRPPHERQRQANPGTALPAATPTVAVGALLAMLPLRSGDARPLMPRSTSLRRFVVPRAPPALRPA